MRFSMPERNVHLFKQSANSLKNKMSKLVCMSCPNLTETAQLIFIKVIRVNSLNMIGIYRR